MRAHVRYAVAYGRDMPPVAWRRLGTNEGGGRVVDGAAAATADDGAADDADDDASKRSSLIPGPGRKLAPNTQAHTHT